MVRISAATLVALLVSGFGLLVVSGQTPTPAAQTPVPEERGPLHRATVLTRIEDGQRPAPDGTIVYFIRVLPPVQTQPVVPANPMFILCGQETVTVGTVEFEPRITEDCAGDSRIAIEVQFPDERPPIASRAEPPLAWRPAIAGEAVRTLTITPIPPPTAIEAGAKDGPVALPAVGAGVGGGIEFARLLLAAWLLALGAASWRLASRMRSAGTPYRAGKLTLPPKPSRP